MQPSSILHIHRRISDIMQKTQMPNQQTMRLGRLRQQHLSSLAPSTNNPRGSHVEGLTKPSFSSYISSKSPQNSRFSQSLETMIRQEAQKQQVSPQLIKAIVQIESGGKASARSPKGALGLMQLMPNTARELGVRDPLNPRQNLAGGIHYLKKMAHRFGDLDLALAAYNAGPKSVEKYKGIPPYQETRQYIQKIRKYL